MYWAGIANVGFEASESRNGCLPADARFAPPGLSKAYNKALELNSPRVSS